MARIFFEYNDKVDWCISNPPYSIFRKFFVHGFKISDVMERISITAFSDLSLTRELCSLVGKTIDLSDHDGAYTMDDETDSSQLS